MMSIGTWVDGWAQCRYDACSIRPRKRVEAGSVAQHRTVTAAHKIFDALTPIRRLKVAGMVPGQTEARAELHGEALSDDRYVLAARVDVRAEIPAPDHACIACYGRSVISSAETRNSNFTSPSQ